MLIYKVKRYLHISSTHNLLPHIQIDIMSSHKVGTNDKLAHNIGNNKNMAYNDVADPHLHFCFNMDGGRLQ